MSLSSVELWQRITARQLASPMQCRAWAADATAGLSATEALDGERLAAQLVTLGKLTQFQADIIVAGADEPLVRNGWRILEPVNIAPHVAPSARCVWNDWWVATKGPNAPVQWLRWLDVASLKSPAIAACNPALPFALRQSQIRSDGLQGMQPPELADGCLQLCMEPVPGNLLSSMCDGQAKPVEDVTAIIQWVAAALAAMHSAGLAHGRVAPDRIALGNDGTVHLLRDPLCSFTAACQPDDARSAPSGLLASRLPTALRMAHFMAPEFLAPAQVATPSSDCYSLGCIAWLLLTGNVPHAGTKSKGQSPSSEAILAAHADSPLDVRAIEHVPEPIRRCLLHCLAKNPSARFQDAHQLARSLHEARRIVAEGLVTNKPVTKQTSDNSVTKPATSTVQTSASAVTKSAATQPIAPQETASRVAAAQDAAQVAAVQAAAVQPQATKRDAVESAKEVRTKTPVASSSNSSAKAATSTQPANQSAAVCCKPVCCEINCSARPARQDCCNQRGYECSVKDRSGYKAEGRVTFFAGFQFCDNERITVQRESCIFRYDTVHSFAACSCSTHSSTNCNCTDRSPTNSPTRCKHPTCSTARAITTSCITIS